MSRIPLPLTTPAGPTYEGRLLERADDEVVDQGASFDLGTIVSRRGVLAMLGLGAGAVTLAACTTTTSSSSGGSASTADGSASTSDGEIPDETAGPYPGDGSNGVDILEESGIVRSDIRSSLAGGATASGVDMALSLTILDMAAGNAPMANAAVYVWHCDAAGGYSLYSDGIEGESYLRGVQVTDAAGRVDFTSIYPACYSGRWPHIHFEVYPTVDDIADSTKAIATSQVALPQDASMAVYELDEYAGSTANLSQVSLDSDNVFGDDGGASQLGTVTGGAEEGYAVALTVRIDTATVPTSGSSPAGGAPGNPPGT